MEMEFLSVIGFARFLGFFFGEEYKPSTKISQNITG
jgi:hypothetical protein